MVAPAEALPRYQRRVQSLEKEVRDLRASNAALREQAQEAADRVAAREREIARLSRALEKERDLDRLALQYRNETSEKMILSLNQQIDFLSEQVPARGAALTSTSSALVVTVVACGCPVRTLDCRKDSRPAPAPPAAQVGSLEAQLGPMDQAMKEAIEARNTAESMLRQASAENDRRGKEITALQEAMVELR